jgi:hypothetical protein
MLGADRPVPTSARVLPKARDHNAGCNVILPTQEDHAMADKEQLKPDDFPVHIESKKIVKPDGNEIAEARSPKIAEEVAERLNTEEHLREQDRWA